MAGQSPEKLKALRRKFGLGEFRGRPASTVDRVKGRPRVPTAPRPRPRAKRRAVGVRGGVLVPPEGRLLPDGDDSSSERSDAAVKAIAERGNLFPAAGLLMP